MKRRTHRLMKILLFDNVKNPTINFAIQNITEESIIRTYKELPPCTDNNRTPRRTNTRINYCYMNGSLGKGSIRTQQDERTSFDVLWRDVVSQIDNCCGVID